MQRAGACPQPTAAPSPAPPRGPPAAAQGRGCLTCFQVCEVQGQVEAAAEDVPAAGRPAGGPHRLAVQRVSLQAAARVHGVPHLQGKRQRCQSPSLAPAREKAPQAAPSLLAGGDGMASSTWAARASALWPAEPLCPSLRECVLSEREPRRPGSRTATLRSLQHEPWPDRSERWGASRERRPSTSGPARAQGSVQEVVSEVAVGPWEPQSQRQLLPCSPRNLTVPGSWSPK